MTKNRETLDTLIAKLEALRLTHGGDTPVVRVQDRHGPWITAPEISEARLASDESKLVSRQGKPCIIVR